MSFAGLNAPQTQRLAPRLGTGAAAVSWATWAGTLQPLLPVPVIEARYGGQGHYVHTAGEVAAPSSVRLMNYGATRADIDAALARLAALCGTIVPAVTGDGEEVQRVLVQELADIRIKKMAPGFGVRDRGGQMKRMQYCLSLTASLIRQPNTT